MENETEESLFIREELIVLASETPDHEDADRGRGLLALG